ncbi:hypothetical protein PYCC9005_004408 [Savitreella phatthalungensis]
MGKQTLTVTDNRTGKTIEVPIKNNSVPATAFKQLRCEGLPREEDPDNGLRIFDAGFLNTAVTQSKITFIDPKGVLRYRGYAIEDLAEKSTFLDTAYLLIYGELPDQEQSSTFSNEVMQHTFVAEDLSTLIKSFRYDAHPMSILVSGWGAMAAYAPDANPALRGQNIYKSDKALMNKQIIRILGKATTLAAMAYRLRIGRPFVQPRRDLGYVENFLFMLDSHGEVGEHWRPDPRIVKVLEVLFILHADHELNCSTASAMQVGSSLVDPYSAIAAATAALYGPLHGGANQAAIEMLQEIGSVDNVRNYLAESKAKKRNIAGIGHRLYRAYDPRAKMVRAAVDTVFEIMSERGDRDPLFDVAMALEKAILEDDYFVKRNLLPNVDMYTGIIYKALGLPVDYFTVLFATPRCVGWLAHWKQLIDTPGTKIWRPRQLYVGSGPRKFVPLEQRPRRAVHDDREGLKAGSLPHYYSRRKLVSAKL